MENKNNLGVKKGAWTIEEDTLLRNCVHKFGEGNWHKVPLRAGLNRCRRSCRLRWLNYLRPNLKKGYFNKDEADLVQRLHKLLGNKWSLIAGRIPGRTANNVKNFWNIHILNKSKSKSSSSSLAMETKTLKSSSDEKHIVIKPRPRTLSKTHVAREHEHGGNSNKKAGDDDGKNISSTSFDDDEIIIKNNVAAFSLSEEEVDECIRLWLEGDD